MVSTRALRILATVSTSLPQCHLRHGWGPSSDNGEGRFVSAQLLESFRASGNRTTVCADLEHQHEERLSHALRARSGGVPIWGLSVNHCGDARGGVSAAALAEALRPYLSDPSRGARHGMAAKQSLKKLDTDRFAENIASVFNSVRSWDRPASL